MRCLMAGQLARVHVPTIEEVGQRELVRAREDLRRDLMSARRCYYSNGVDEIGIYRFALEWTT